MQRTISSTQKTSRWQRLRPLSLAVLIALVGLAALFVFIRPPVAAERAATPAAAPISFPLRRPFGTGSDATVALAVGDMDGDGDLDIVASNRGEPSSIALNDGAGNFPLSRLITFGAAAEATDLAVGDLDGDGDLDGVISTDDGACTAYLNDGSGKLAQEATAAPRLDPGNDSRVALGDLNGNGYFDIVLTRRHGPTLLLFNDGTAHFPLSSTLTGEGDRAASVALGHLDSDGKLDIVVAPESGVGVIFYQGTGAFAITRTWGISDQSVRDITPGDFDGNGRLDFVATQIGSAPHKLYLNLSQNPFGTAAPFGRGTGALWSVAAGDLNGDGSLDLVAGIGAKRWLSRIMLNAGGSFPAAQMTGFGPPDENTRAVAVADLNGDGLLDIVTGNNGSENALYLNGQEIAFTAAEPDAGRWSRSRQMTSVAVGDLTGDGRLDIVTGNLLEKRGGTIENLVLINQGNGKFGSQSFGLLARSTWSIALADLNGDALLDVVAGAENGMGTVHLSDRAGRSLTGRFPAALRYDLPANPAVTTVLTTTVATGDLDHKDGLDLVACSLTGGCMTYRNNGAGRFSAGQAATLGAPDDPAAGVAVSDLDRDSHLDIVVGNLGAPNYVYFNDGQGGFPVRLRRPYGTGHDFTRAVAVADVNADGWPDILAANFFERGTIYLNDGAGSFPAALARPFGGSTDRIYSLAAGDINGDGYVDFVAGHWGTESVGGQNILYLNDGRGNFTPSALGSAAYWTRSVALGDMDGNGTLDVVEANRFGGKRLLVHTNRLRDSNSTGNQMPSLLINRPLSTQNAALNSSPQRLAAGAIPVSFTLRDRESERVGRVALDYALDGGVWKQIELTDTLLSRDLTTSPDGALHQVTWDTRRSGVFGRSDSAMLRLRAYPQPDRPAEPGTYRYTNTVPALNQWPYFAAATFPFSIQGTSVLVSGDTGPASDALVYRIPAGKERNAAPLGGIQEPFRTATDGFLPGRAEIQAGKTVTESDKLVAVWPAAGVTAVTPTRFYTSSDTFPLTTTADMPIRSRAVIADARRIADIQVWAALSATVPISLNLLPPTGDPIAVFSGDLPPGAGATPWRAFTPTLPAGKGPLADGAWTLEVSTAMTEPVQLLGWSLALKLSPLNYTSAAPITTGLGAQPVTADGVQVLTVNSQNPLLLFDLNVALEWNASEDARYRSQLSADLRRASELLYDWTNGQMALGNVRVYHDARRNTLPDGTNAWNNAHVRIYASNRLRPNADQGGIVSEVYTETVRTGNPARPVSYLPGQVRMGATWNRYGDAETGNLGDDWPAALAHELGHYLLFLDDNYLTLRDNLIVPLSDDACPGAMNNPYSNAYSEFHPAADWTSTACTATLSTQNTGRSDWETIKQFYPDVVTPTGVFSTVLSGPSLLPLAVTQIQYQTPDPGSDTLTYLARLFGLPDETPEATYGRLCASRPGDQPLDMANLPEVTDTGARTPDLPRTLDPSKPPVLQCRAPITSTQPLAVPIFYLKGMAPEGAAGSQARAFLFQGPPYPTVIDLGQPIGAQVVAHGARPGDRLCVYDLPNGRVGCEAILAGDDQLAMKQPADWAPEIILSPGATSRVLTVTVNLPNVQENRALTLTARLYPLEGPAPAAVALDRVRCEPELKQCTYRTTLTSTLASGSPVLEGYVLVGESKGALGAIGTNPRQAITEFAIGGNPVRIRARHSPADSRSAGGRALRVRIRPRHAPATSADGQVMIYPDEEVLSSEAEWSFTLQPATRLPAELPWATQVGRAYWLTASPNLTDFGQSSITFEYLRSDVPAGEETFIRMYFWDAAAQGWAPLEGQTNYPEYNLISARLRGPGLYTLFSHYDIPLQPGWNLIGYPVQGSRQITDALASIAGKYSMVFGFDDAGSPAEPWAAYLPGAGDWANDLREFRFGRGYWIYVTDPGAGEDGVVMHLRGSPATAQPVARALAAKTLPNPPAIYFGTVQSERTDVALAPDAKVQAYIGDALCGEDQLDSALRYAIKVRAVSAREGGCGTPGAPVTFRIAGLPDVTLASAAWDNGAPHPQDLRVPAGQPAAPEEPPVVCQELVREGTFETDAAWKRLLTDNQGRVLQRDAEHGRSLLLGALPGEAAPRKLTYSTAFQNNIRLPAAASAITLSFLVQTDAGADGRSVQIYRPDWSYPPLVTAPIAGGADWQTVTIDLTPLKGQPVSLYFEVANAGSRPARWMVIDDVSIRACP